MRNLPDGRVELNAMGEAEELEAFLAFLVGLEATAKNAGEAAADRLRKLRIAKKWESPN